MTQRILAVDDEPDHLALLEMNLQREGYIVDTAKNAAEAFARIRAQKPDLILLDLILPDVSGLKVAAQLKNDPETANIPIIMVTAKDSDTDMVVGFTVGADDYITKPFSTAVLVARVEAVLKRSYERRPGVEDILMAGPIKVVWSRHQVFVGDKPVELTQAEFRMLAALMRAHGAVLSHEKLIAEVGSEDVSERIIPVHISSLRKKLGEAKDRIKTVHGLGYRIEI